MLSALGSSLWGLGAEQRQDVIIFYGIVLRTLSQ